jgi:hypothetical protein
MNSPDVDEGDPGMAELFSAVAPEALDAGFTDRAMRRLARRVWIRRVASGAALAVALPMMITLLAALLLPTEAWPPAAEQGGLGWVASVALAVCLPLLLRVAATVRD